MQFSTSQWPQNTPAYKGNVSINGYPAGPKDSYMTIGGLLDPNDAYNGSITTAPFGVVVSAVNTSPDLWVLGNPNGYIFRGILIVDESIMYNEPFKPNSYAIGLNATAMINGYFRLSSWLSSASGALATPYPGSVKSDGNIQFLASGISVAPSGYFLIQNSKGVQNLSVVDNDPLLGSTSAGGLLLYLSQY